MHRRRGGLPCAHHGGVSIRYRGDAPAASIKIALPRTSVNPEHTVRGRLKKAVSEVKLTPSNVWMKCTRCADPDADRQAGRRAGPTKRVSEGATVII
ncbi:hypothetical protein KCP73_08385 [Salmonella enterica subsp. enterica]|nr:hypothetical protein KCP73_08385 [Salmonella enterica subsp. enterica]